MIGGRCRVAIENVRPEIDGGRFPAKRVVGERVIVEADIFADGHDAIAVAKRHAAKRIDDLHAAGVQHAVGVGYATSLQKPWVRLV